MREEIFFHWRTIICYFSKILLNRDLGWELDVFRVIKIWGFNFFRFYDIYYAAVLSFLSRPLFYCPFAHPDSGPGSVLGRFGRYFKWKRLKFQWSFIETTFWYVWIRWDLKWKISVFSNWLARKSTRLNLLAL